MERFEIRSLVVSGVKMDPDYSSIFRVMDLAYDRNLLPIVQARCSTS